MDEFPKIQTIWKREPKGDRRLIIPQFSTDEFRYLMGLRWVWTEKVDGMNLRVIYGPAYEMASDMGTGFTPASLKLIKQDSSVVFKGKTDRAQLPDDLTGHLTEIFTPEKMEKQFPNSTGICLYGEGYGPGIQKGGKYREDQGFILFDIKVGHWWLKRDALEEIALALEIPLVPVVTVCNLLTATLLTKRGIYSSCGEFNMEGLVGQPEVPLFCRNGQRVITKIKHADFKGEPLTHIEEATLAGSSWTRLIAGGRRSPGTSRVWS